MGKVKVNGKEMSKKEAMDLLDKEETVVNSFSAEIENPNKKLDEMEMTNEGFPIGQDMISEMSEAMDEYGASCVKVKLAGSPKIKGRNLYLVMCDTDDSINEVLGED